MNQVDVASTQVSSMTQMFNIQDGIVKKSRFQKSSSHPGSLSGPSWMEDGKKEHSQVDECIPNADDLLLSVHKKMDF